MQRWAVLLTPFFLLAGCPAPDAADAGLDAPTIDAPVRDVRFEVGGGDVGRIDAPVLDTEPPMDSPTVPDAPIELDAPADAPPDLDVPADAPPDLDVPADAPLDVPADAPLDVPADAPRDAGTDSPGCSVDGDCPTALTCLPTMSCGCPGRLDPLSDGMGRLPDIVLSEIVPGAGGYIELYNTTSAAITLPGTYQLCSPFAYAGLGTGTIPAHGYLSMPWPAFFTDTLAGGEVILYSDSFFGTPSSVMDFVCWGTNPHATRQSTAFSAGRWSSSSGGCAPAITGGAIHRRPMTDGIDASDYDTTSRPSGVSCTP